MRLDQAFICVVTLDQDVVQTVKCDREHPFIYNGETTNYNTTPVFFATVR